MKTDQSYQVDDPDQMMLQYKKTGAVDLRNHLIMHYSYVAKTVAIDMSNTFHKYATVEEMVNQGIIAIIDSLDRFNPEQGVKFSTFAYTKVRGAVIDYVRKQDWLPRRVRRNAIKLNTAHDELTGILGHNPSRDELAEHLGLSAGELDKTVYEVAGESMVSFESMLANGLQANSLWSAGNDFDPEKQLDEEVLKQELANAVDALNGQERTVLSLYYYENLTMKEISQVMRVSEQRIGQINRKLLSKMRDHLSKTI